jgi:high affinity Mn2+ porin
MFYAKEGRRYRCVISSLFISQTIRVSIASVLLVGTVSWCLGSDMPVPAQVNNAGVNETQTSSPADRWKPHTGTVLQTGAAVPNIAPIQQTPIPPSPTLPPESLAGLIPSIRPGPALPPILATDPAPAATIMPLQLNDKEPENKDKANGNDKKAEDDKDKQNDKWKLLPEGWNFHAQATLMPEFDAGFGAKYSGPNSLSPQAQRAGTISADLFLGVPLWHGAEFHSDLLLWQGFGLSNTFGLNADPNGDAYKAGTIDPRFMFAHFFVRQNIGLGGEQEDVPDGPLSLPSKQDISRLTITVGRMSVADIFDKNTYDHDPHTQFMNWGNMMLTYDYPSDTIGYTTGIAIELNEKDWTLRYGWFQMPATPNGFTADDRIFTWPNNEPGDGPTSDGEFWKEWGMVLELERRWRIEDHPGAIRLSAWLEHGYWASYHQATALLLASPPPPNSPQGVETTVPVGAFGFHTKYGFGVNWEQEIAKNVGIFGRLGWQDGQTAAATYNDSNWTAQLGLSVKGEVWHRPGDTWGLCGQLDGASSAQIAFLKAGGTGISDGDGNLSYAPEITFETYYDFEISKNCHFALDYQFYANPSFNRVRGPVNVFMARLHWEY